MFDNRNEDEEEEAVEKEGKKIPTKVTKGPKDPIRM